MSVRLVLLACCSACAVSTLARADLKVTLPAPTLAQPAPKSAARAPAKPKPDAKRPIDEIPPELLRPGAPYLASRSMPQQVGVVRRGHAPVLPPIEAAMADAPESQLSGSQKMEVSARLGKMLAPSTDAFQLPDATSKWVGRIKQDQQVAIVSQWQSWYAIVMSDGSQAYVPQAYVEVLPYEVKSVVKVPEPATAPAPPPFKEASFQASSIYGAMGTQLAQAVIDEAFRYQDVKYVWGGNTARGVDCSGLVKNCFAACGVSLPRRASEQARVGQEVPFDQLQPGDRLYFSVKRQFDHTAIYLGNGYFIHASMSRGKVGVDHLSTPLYGNHLTAARRL